MSSSAPNALSERPGSQVLDSEAHSGTEKPGKLEAHERGRAALLLASVFVIAICGLIYELLAGTLSTYLLGSSITQFSIVIGLFLTAMGIGSFLSRYVRRNLLSIFLGVEIAVGLIGGLTPLVLFYAFALFDTYTPILVVLMLVTGSLVGLEIPLLVRLVKEHSTLRDALGNVLSLDYLGALAASLLFPLVLVPKLGLVRTGCLFGLLNVVVAFCGLAVFRGRLRRPQRLIFGAAATAAILVVGLVTAGKATALAEDLLYDDEILFAQTTPYQRLVLTRWRDDVRLFINGNVQFSSKDEFRYHESLVHPVMSAHPAGRRILILGGGDGMAVRELLKYPRVERIDLVDLDPAMTKLFRTQPFLVKLNDNALSSPKVHITNADAQKFLEGTSEAWDVVIIDLPDPNSEGLGKLYTRSFYRLLAKHLAPQGLFVTQATSPFYATAAFWCIANTIEASNARSGGATLRALPYHANIPSFGDWGFIIGGFRKPPIASLKLSVPTRYLNTELINSALFTFGKDIAYRKTPVNRLDNQILVKLYEKGYGRYNAK